MTGSETSRAQELRDGDDRLWIARSFHQCGIGQGDDVVLADGGGACHQRVLPQRLDLRRHRILRACAVVTKFSTRNPGHESRIKKLLEKEFPHVTMGHTLSGKWPHFRHRLKMGKDQLPSLLTINYGANTWDVLGSKCLACGSCTNVCPTCFCFDVQDECEITMQDGERYRQWDSCQLHEFALVAGGHNFRDSKASRIRHRFMRKAKYIQQVHGLLGCTGCGRCERACLVNITIPGTLNALYEETQIDAGL